MQQIKYGPVVRVDSADFKIAVPFANRGNAAHLHPPRQEYRVIGQHMYLAAAGTTARYGPCPSSSPALRHGRDAVIFVHYVVSMHQHDREDREELEMEPYV